VRLGLRGAVRRLRTARRVRPRLAGPTGFRPAGLGRLSGMPPTIMWFRRDLRLADHPALLAAIADAGGDATYPVGFAPLGKLIQVIGNTRSDFAAFGAVTGTFTLGMTTEATAT